MSILEDLGLLRRQAQAQREEEYHLSQKQMRTVHKTLKRQDNGSSSTSRPSYEIEVSHNDELFVINGEKFEAQTYCFDIEEGDKVIFLEGSPYGTCASAEILNLRTKEVCEVWCESSRLIRRQALPNAPPPPPLETTTPVVPDNTATPGTEEYIATYPKIMSYLGKQTQFPTVKTAKDFLNLPTDVRKQIVDSSVDDDAKVEGWDATKIAEVREFRNKYLTYGDMKNYVKPSWGTDQSEITEDFSSYTKDMDRKAAWVAAEAKRKEETGVFSVNKPSTAELVATSPMLQTQFIGEEIIGIIIGSVLGAFFSAFLVQFATKAIANFKPTYRTAYFASFTGSLSTNGLGFIIGLAVAASGNVISWVGYGILMIIGFVLSSWILGFLLKHPETGTLGFKTGTLISLIWTGVVFAIVLVGAVLFGFITK
jgi:hypothetical protein